MKNRTREIIAKKLGIMKLRQEDQEKIIIQVVDLAVQQTLDELTDEFSREELEKISELEESLEFSRAFANVYSEKLDNFEKIFNLKINFIINDFRTKICS